MYTFSLKIFLEDMITVNNPHDEFFYDYIEEYY